LAQKTINKENKIPEYQKPEATATATVERGNTSSTAMVPAASAPKSTSAKDMTPEETDAALRTMGVDPKRIRRR
jgi:hypothetical protein